MLPDLIPDEVTLMIIMIIIIPVIPTYWDFFGTLKFGSVDELVTFLRRVRIFLYYCLSSTLVIADNITHTVSNRFSYSHKLARRKLPCRARSWFLPPTPQHYHHQHHYFCLLHATGQSHCCILYYTTPGPPLPLHLQHHYNGCPI